MTDAAHMDDTDRNGAPPDLQETSRRDFLKLAWNTATVTALGASGYVGFRFLGSRVVETDFGKVLRVGVVDDYPPGTVTAINNGRFYMVRAQDGGFLALYRKCTHLDCTVLWEPENMRFYCPCHGSAFDLDGTVQNPPAPLPLIRFPIDINARGRIEVDTGTLIERSEALPSDYTYPPSSEEGEA